MCVWAWYWYTVSQRQIIGIKGFSSSPQAALLSSRRREIRIKLKDPQQPAGRKQQRKKKLAIKQERISFLHPNENSSCEIDDSVWKHNYILAIMRSYLRNWVYIPQAEKQSRLPRISVRSNLKVRNFHCFSTPNKIKLLNININCVYMTKTLL